MALQEKTGTDLRVASLLSDVTEGYVWYSLQFPELLEKVSPRVGHSLVSLKPGTVLMIGGGNHCGALQEIFTIQLEPIAATDNAEGGNSREEKRVSEHPAKSDFEAKYEFSCTKDSDGKVWIFGGADTHSSNNQIWKLGEESLELVESVGDVKGPCPRTQGSNSALVEIEERSCIAIFAGGLKGEEPVSDRELYLFDTAESKWEKVPIKIDEKVVSELPFDCQPPAVQGHAMTAVGSKILLYGGINHSTLYDGCHWMNLKEKNDDSSYSWIDSRVNISNTRPTARAAHGIAKVADVDSTSQILYMFGGLGEKGARNDLWSLNLDTMSWTEIMKHHGTDSYGYYPRPRLDFGMCTVGLQDSVCGNGAGALSVFLIIHGGMNEQGELFNDAWIMKVS